MNFTNHIINSSRRLLGIVMLLLLCHLLSAQIRTVGVFQNDSLAFNGYTLFSPSSSNNTYLIDNCGHLIHTWQSTYNPGLSSYLLEDGSLLRTGRVNSDFNAGGTGGRIEKYTWEGNLLFGFDYSSDTYHQHHDVAPLPNGNVLILAWESITREEALEAGRDPSAWPSDRLWYEHIVEWKSLGGDLGEIVWEWHLEDHLVQEFDSTKNNYGVVAESPELFDLNYVNGGGPDWIHANSIDYNEELDQIVISSRHWSEFFIIDHSTTTEEAKGHTGGKSGKGGDVLYRWGNPETYGRGDSTNKKLYGQHDVHWIPKGLPDAGKILIFNNGLSRPDGNFSTVEMVEPPMDSDGQYILDAGLTYGPDTAFLVFKADPANTFFSGRVSGAQRLPNGNTLICEGTSGNIFEVTEAGEIVWDYICPIRGNGVITQGVQPGGNQLFRATRYATNYGAFENRDLSPGDLIEANPIDDECQIYLEKTNVGIVENQTLEGVQLFPNPLSDVLQVQNDSGEEIRLELTDLAGRLLWQKNIPNGNVVIPFGEWSPGAYFVRMTTLRDKRFTIRKIFKY